MTENETPEPVDVTAPDYDCGGGEGGMAFNGCLIADAGAGVVRCAGCANREAQRLVAVDLQAKTNYCVLMGHHWRVIEDEEAGEMVLVCLNHCQYNGIFKLVPRV